MRLRAGIYLAAILPFESPSLLHYPVEEVSSTPSPQPSSDARQCHSNLDEDSCWRLSRRHRQPHLPLHFERLVVSLSIVQDFKSINCIGKLS